MDKYFNDFFNDFMKEFSKLPNVSIRGYYQDSNGNRSFFNENDLKGNKLSNDMTSNLRSLEARLKSAIEAEDYMSAATLRDQIKDFKENYLKYETQIKELFEKKKIAVDKELFEEAAELKKQIDELTDKLK